MRTLLLTLALGQICYYKANAFQHGGGLFRSRPRTVSGMPTYSSTVSTPYYPSMSPFTFPLLLENAPDWAEEMEYEQGTAAEATAAQRQAEEDDLLSYLPWFVLQQETPRSESIILQATRQYIYADTRGDPQVNVTHILEAIEAEYKVAEVPVQVGTRTYSVERNRQHSTVARILSFAAYHRLPMEITLVLLKSSAVTDSDEGELLKTAAQDFQDGDGWNGVSFPRGLAIRLNRKLLQSRLQRYQPIPRTWLLRQNQFVANKAVKEAAKIKPPVQQLLTRQAFLDSLTKDMSQEKHMLDWKMMLKDSLPFFPTRRNLFRFVVRHTSRFRGIVGKMMFRIKQSLRATLLAYSLLAYAWYNMSLLWSWQKLSTTFLASGAVNALSCSLQRLASVSRHTSGLSITNVPVLAVALLLAPIAHRFICSLQRKWGVTDANVALVLVESTLALSHVFLGAGVLFLDAAILRTIVL